MTPEEKNPVAYEDLQDELDTKFSEIGPQEVVNMISQLSSSAKNAKPDVTYVIVSEEGGCRDRRFGFTFV